MKTRTLEGRRDGGGRSTPRAVVLPRSINTKRYAAETTAAAPHETAAWQQKWPRHKVERIPHKNCLTTITLVPSVPPLQHTSKQRCRRIVDALCRNLLWSRARPVFWCDIPQRYTPALCSAAVPEAPEGNAARTLSLGVTPLSVPPAALIGPRKEKTHTHTFILTFLSAG